MIAFTAFKTKKPRGFNYIPRYFNPEQEAREQRRSELLGDQVDESGSAQDSKDYKPGQYINEIRLRRGIITNNRTTRRKNPGVNKVRILLLVGMVAVILWWIYM